MNGYLVDNRAYTRTGCRARPRRSMRPCPLDTATAGSLRPHRPRATTRRAGAEGPAHGATTSRLVRVANGGPQALHAQASGQGEAVSLESPEKPHPEETGAAASLASGPLSAARRCCLTPDLRQEPACFRQPHLAHPGPPGLRLPRRLCSTGRPAFQAGCSPLPTCRAPTPPTRHPVQTSGHDSCHHPARQIQSNLTAPSPTSSLRGPLPNPNAS